MLWALTSGVRRMRTRFSPRCTSSSLIPVSATTLINSRISSMVMNNLVWAKLAAGSD
jgi:hypothetical protein